MKLLRQMVAISGLWLCALAPLATLSSVVQAATLAPQHADTTVLAGAPLQLNGEGVRYKAVFRVYSAALYLEQRAHTPQDVVSLKGPKRLTITMLRDIDAAELGKLFSRGMQDNMDRAAFSKLVPGVMRMSDIFSAHKKLQAGDQFMIDWIPGTGTVITVKGAPQGEPFREPEFYSALMNIWLGNVPADWKLKDALLGKVS